jgi:hypothetical protein
MVREEEDMPEMMQLLNRKGCRMVLHQSQVEEQVEL